MRWAVEYEWPAFVESLAAWREAADLETPSTDDEADQAARELHHSRSWRGRGVLDATLTPEVAETLDELLQPIVDRLFADDWAAARAIHGDRTVDAKLARTQAQRRHDAFAMLLDRAAMPGTGNARPLYTVHLTLDDLRHVLALDAGLPSLPPPPERSMRRFSSGARITPTATVRGLIDAHLRTVVFDPTGEVLHLGRLTRWFTAAQKRAMVARDRWCRCGCGLRAELCHADHIIEWVPDRTCDPAGRTDLTNCQPLCPTSHRRKTADSGWQPPPQPDRVWTIAWPRRVRPGRGRDRSDPAD